MTDTLPMVICYNFYLHEVVVVGQLPALPPDLQACCHLQLALSIHDHNTPRNVVYTADHITHHLHSQASLQMCCHLT